MNEFQQQQDLSSLIFMK